MPTALEALYDALENEEPLDLDKPADRNLYVADLHVSDQINPVDELLLQVRRARVAGAWFFTGHRGVGKSTELRRVAHELRGEGHSVLVADMGEYLNLVEPISVELLLLAMMAALSSEVERVGGANPTHRGFVTRLKDWLTRTEVHIDEFEGAVELGGATLGAKALLKDNPSLRERVVQAVKQSTGSFVAEVRDYAAEVVKLLQQGRADKKVVLILDSLERLRFGGLDSAARFEGAQQTFDTYADYLKFDTLNVVYSIPPFLTHLSSKLGSYFGVSICTLPHVKVFERPVAGGPRDQRCEAGVNSMLESLVKRYPEAYLAIDKPLLERLVLASSGSVRDFFRLVRTACIKGMLAKEPLPIRNEKWIAAAEQTLRNEMPLAEDDIAWLKKVRATHGTGLDKIENLPALARLFDGGLILGYRNSEDWCDVHYLLRQRVDAAVVGTA